MSLAGAQLARAAADAWTARTPDKPRFVAGSVGPLNVTLSLSPKVDDPAYRAVRFDQVREAYEEQIAALRDGGVDLLMVETIFDTLNAKAAIVAARAVAPELPLWLSFTAIDKSGRNLSGQTSEAFWISVEHAEPFIVGVNCSLGATEMRPFLEGLANVASTYVACHPNAGLPNALGLHDEQAADTSRYLRAFAEDGLVNLVGGCCGTMPEHTHAIARAVEGLPPRAVPPRSAQPRFSGLEPFMIRPDTGFVVVGERTNVTGSARFRRLIEANDFQGAVDVALEQVRGGANLLDVNMDADLLDAEQAMTTFLNLLATEPEAARSRSWSTARASPRSRPASVPPGQGRRQLDLAQGGRGAVSRAGTDSARFRRRQSSSWPSTRRARRRRRAQGRDPRACLRPPDRDRGLRAGGHHPRPEHPRRRHRDRGARVLREGVHRGDPAPQGALPGRARLGRCVESLVRVPRERRRARGDARRPSSTTRSARGSTWGS